uniref:ELM2 domain-containing protein n=1 Tax=Caenorhabditis tropicalis TaxID=1561998 RepID=A0A1I7UF24_9PELO
MAPTKISRPASMKSSKKVNPAPKKSRATSEKGSARSENKKFIVVELPDDKFPIKEHSKDLVEWDDTEVDLSPALEANLKNHPECRKLLDRYRKALSSRTPVSLRVMADDLHAKIGDTLYEIDVLSITAKGKVRLGWKIREEKEEAVAPTVRHQDLADAVQDQAFWPRLEQAISAAKAQERALGADEALNEFADRLIENSTREAWCSMDFGVRTMRTIETAMNALRERYEAELRNCAAAKATLLDGNTVDINVAAQLFRML